MANKRTVLRSKGQCDTEIYSLVAHYVNIVK